MTVRIHTVEVYERTNAAAQAVFSVAIANAIFDCHNEQDAEALSQSIVNLIVAYTDDFVKVLDTRE